MAVGGVAVAADAPAVEWKVIDGGNGHWYQGVVVSTAGDPVHILQIRSPSHTFEKLPYLAMRY